MKRTSGLQFTSVMLAAALLASCLGCGDSGATMAPVKGTVKYNGAAVNGGSLVFTPVSVKEGGQKSKPAEAVVGSDGTFTLTTHNPNEEASCAAPSSPSSPSPWSPCRA